MKNIALYMAGSIQKGHERGNELCWTENHFDEIRRSLGAFQVTFLNPAFRTDDLSDQKSVFGRDMTQVYSCDVVLVDARARRGLGVGAEMMWAKLNSIPVVTWAPLESHYNKSETHILGVAVKGFIHPFVEGLSDWVVSNLDEACLSIKKALFDPTFTPKGIDYIASCMEYYKKTGLIGDLPMLEIMQTNPIVKQKIESLYETTEAL